MTGLRELLTDVFGALVVHSSTSYSWLGERFEHSSPPGPIPAGDATSLASELTRRLYIDFYCTGGVVPASKEQRWRMAPWPSPEIAELSAANCGCGSPQHGWVVRGREGRTVILERDGLRLWVDERRILREPDTDPAVTTVGVLLPKEQLGAPLGFYAAFGDAGAPDSATDWPVDRFYWNVRHGGRAALVRAVTSTLNTERIPFRFKVLSDPNTLRCDAGVLYTSRGDRRRARSAVAELWRAVSSHLRPATPVFTRALAAGLGFAEDPQGQESFGTHRCRLVAEAVVACHSRGARSVAARLRTLEEGFEAAGVSLDRPYANLGSHPDDDPAPLQDG